MTLLIMDGFESLKNSNLKWNQFGNNSSSSSNTRFGYGLSAQRASFHLAVLGEPEVVVGGAISHSYPSTSSVRISFMYGTNYQFTVVFILGSGITFRLGGAGSTIVHQIDNVTPGINTWYYVEVKYRAHNTTGYCEVRVNGSSVGSYSGDTKASSANPFNAIDANVDLNALIDDVYILDTAGPTNNDFLGDSRVYSLAPSGPGSETDLTPVGLSGNWQNAVDLSDSNYNESSVVGDKDLYQMSDIGTSTATIHGVQRTVAARISDAGSGSIKSIVKSGGVEYPGAAKSLGSGYMLDRAVLETDPATSAAWTASGVNSAELGVEVV